MEIVVQSKNSLFQQKFHTKLYISTGIQLRSVMQKNDPIGLPESEKKSNSDSQCC